MESKTPFEIHITIEDLDKDNIDKFVKVCSEYDAKAILIELSRGRYTQQPMFTKVVYADSINEAVLSGDMIVASLRLEGFRSNRLKIEVPAINYIPVYTTSYTDHTPYFEWHGKINLEREEDLMLLCARNNVHLSSNSLKDDKNARFVTLREYGTIESFKQRTEKLLSDMEIGGWVVGKTQSEYCLYDSNVILDLGWL